MDKDFVVGIDIGGPSCKLGVVDARGEVLAQSVIKTNDNPDADVIIKELAEEESCIILGRCANYLLRDRDDILRVFIHAPLEARRERIAEYSLSWSEREILRHIRTEDKRRAAYYHYYTGEEWRDASAYDLCLDSERLGEDGCVERILSILPFYSREQE